jgi:hypothetical protein
MRHGVSTESKRGNKIQTTRTTHFPSGSLPRRCHSAGAQDEVYAAIRIDDTTNLTHSQRKRRVLERLLHLPMFKRAQVSVVIMRGTIRVLARKPAKLLCVLPNLRFIFPQDRDGLFLRARDLGLLHKS